MKRKKDITKEEKGIERPKEERMRGLRRIRGEKRVQRVREG